MNNVITTVVLNILQKNHHRVYIAIMTGICVGSQGNVREKSGNFFSANPVATLMFLRVTLLLLSILWQSRRT